MTKSLSDGDFIYRSEDDVFAIRGVLKELVPQWLNNPQIRPLILTFDYSRIEDGGEGALTILLRRKRND